MKKPNYFMAVKSWVLWEGCTLSPKARNAALVISNHMFNTPEWTLSLGLIAKKVGCSERTAWAAGKELEKARMFAIESGSMTGAKRANTYTLLAPFTQMRPTDSRNSCEGQETRLSQKVSRRKPRPSQKVKATLAIVANTILSQSSTDSILEKTPSIQRAAIRRIESNEERMRRLA